MKTISASTDIQASPDEVWAVLTDGPGHQAWDPHIERISGDVAVGERLEVKFRDSVTFKPTVQIVEPNRSLEWLGRTLVPGLFDGRHHWSLEATASGTRLTQSEEFTGILVPFMGKLLRKTERQFAASNEALAAEAKARAERGA